MSFVSIPLASASSSIIINSNQSINKEADSKQEISVNKQEIPVSTLLFNKVFENKQVREYLQRFIAQPVTKNHVFTVVSDDNTLKEIKFPVVMVRQRSVTECWERKPIELDEKDQKSKGSRKSSHKVVIHNASVAASSSQRLFYPLRDWLCEVDSIFKAYADNGNLICVNRFFKVKSAHNYRSAIITFQAIQRSVFSVLKKTNVSKALETIFLKAVEGGDLLYIKRIFQIAMPDQIQKLLSASALGRALKNLCMNKKQNEAVEFRKICEIIFLKIEQFGCPSQMFYMNGTSIFFDLIERKDISGCEWLLRRLYASQIMNQDTLTSLFMQNEGVDSTVLTCISRNGCQSIASLIIELFPDVYEGLLRGTPVFDLAPSPFEASRKLDHAALEVVSESDDVTSDVWALPAAMPQTAASSYSLKGWKFAS